MVSGSEVIKSADRVGRRRLRPAQVVVSYDGHRFRLDLATIERAFFRGIVAGKYSDREALAKACGISRSTVSRFFHGRTTSIKVTLAILRELGLDFDDVATPCEGAGC
jgi:transcriptional regulator with XRE-family HTH domain